MAKHTPLKAIRQKFLECSCGHIKEVRLGPIKTCALYEYRMGHRPKGESDTTEGYSEGKTFATRGFFSKKRKGVSHDRQRGK